MTPEYRTFIIAILAILVNGVLLLLGTHLGMDARAIQNTVDANQWIVAAVAGKSLVQHGAQAVRDAIASKNESPETTDPKIRVAR